MNDLIQEREALRSYLRAIPTSPAGYVLGVEKGTLEAVKKIAQLDEVRRTAARIAAIDAILAKQPEEASPKPEQSKAADKRANRRAKCNAAMLAVLYELKEECHGWTVRQWAKHTKFSKSACGDTDVWRDLTEARELAKIGLQNDRRRR